MLSQAIPVTVRGEVAGLVVGYPRGGAVAERVTSILEAIVPEVTGSVDDAVEAAIGIGRDRSFLDDRVSQARSSNVVVWREAGFDVVDTWTKATVGAVVVCYSMSSNGSETVAAMNDVVSREDEDEDEDEDEAKTWHVFKVVAMVVNFSNFN